MKFYGIYKITNLVNGKMYVGQHVTSDLDDGYMGSGKIIKLAIKKYGKENFRKEWLTFCEDQEELDYMERVFADQTWVDRSDTYNLALGGNKRAFSEQTRRKISEAMKGERNHNFGRHHSAEERRKMSEALKGRPLSEEHRRKLSEAHKGNPPTRGMLGKRHSDETKRRMSEANKGKPRSEETKRRISEAKKAYYRKLKETD